MQKIYENQEIKVVIRCPTCSKLYEVDSKLIKSSSPHFDCLVCAEVFSFVFPPKDWKKIQTFKVLDPKSSTQNNSLQRLKKECPKCGILNLTSASECYACQVLFKSFALLKNETFPNALPSLIEAWQIYF